MTTTAAPIEGQLAGFEPWPGVVTARADLASRRYQPPELAPLATRKEFLGVLKQELPPGPQVPLAWQRRPRDLAQAAIRPGMTVFWRYSTVVEAGGESAAAGLLTQVGSLGDVARDLAYRLYNLCERKGWAQEATAYNGLVTAWPELTRLASQTAPSGTGQRGLFGGNETA